MIIKQDPVHTCTTCSVNIDITEVEIFSKQLCPNCSTMFHVTANFHNLEVRQYLGLDYFTEQYLAFDPTLQREVCLKIFNPEYEAYSEVFKTEIQSFANINNDRVVAVFSCGTYNDSFYFVTEALSGNNLTKFILSNQNTTLTSKISLIKELTQSLQVIHRTGNYFGTLSPSDAFCQGSSHIRLADTATAKLRSMMPISSEDIVAYYVAPEVITDQIGSKANDIFALGKIIISIITGQLDGELEQIKNKINANFYTIVELMLSQAPEERPNIDYIVNNLGELKLNTGNKKTFKTNASTRSIPKSVTAAKAKRRSGFSFTWFIIVAIVAGVVGFVIYDKSRGKESILFKPKPPVTSAKATPEADLAASKELEETTKNIVSQEELVAQVNEIKEETPKKETKKVVIKTLPRPRPQGIYFEKRIKDLKEYVESFKIREDVKRERYRVKIIARSRHELKELMGHTPYSPLDRDKLFVDRKKTPTVLVKERCISVKSEGDSLVLMKPKGKRLRLHWYDVPVSQIVEFYRFYFEQRVKFIEFGQDAARKAELKKEAIDTGIRLVLLADWYGIKDVATKYAKEVIKVDHNQTAFLKLMMPYLK